MQKIRSFSKDYPLAAVLLLVFSLSAMALLLRPSEELSILDGIQWNHGSQLAQYAKVQDGAVRYEAYGTEEKPIDFSSGQDVLKYHVPHLKYGVYHLSVEYHTSYNTSDGAADNMGSDSAGRDTTICNFALSGGSGGYMADTAYLYDYKSLHVLPVWVTSLSGADNITLDCNFTGSGACEIKSATIKEYQPWKIGFLLLEALGFALVCLWNYKLGKAPLQKKLGWAFAVFMVLFASYPALAGAAQAYSGHDYPFHLGRIASIANELSYGNFPVLYQSDVGFGFGYIAQLLYGNIFLYVPAAVYLLGMPLAGAYNMFVILVNIVNYAVSWFSFRGFFRENKYAHLGSALYLLAAYRFTNIYVRCAVGEYLAMAFLPLAVYGICKIIYAEGHAGFRDTIPFVLGVTGIVESHILSTELAAIFAGFFCLMHIKAVKKQFGALLKALLAVLSLNAFFLVPFWDTYQARLVIKYGTSLDLSDTGTYFPQLFSLFLTASGDSNAGTAGELPLTVGAPLVLGLLLFFLVCICKKGEGFSPEEQRGHRRAAECFLFSAASLWLSTVYFPWGEIANKDHPVLAVFTSIQFVWRYLSFATVFLVILTVYAVKKLGEHGEGWFQVRRLGSKLSALLLASGIFTIGAFFTDYINVAPLEHTLSWAANVHSDPLYYPTGMDFNRLYDTSVYCDPASAATVRKEGTAGANEKIFSVERVRENCIVTFPVAYYSFLTVYDEGKKEYLPTLPGYNQQLAVALEPGYAGTVRISYHIRWKWKIAYMVSLLAAIFLGVYLLPQPVHAAIGNRVLGRKFRITGKTTKKE